MEYMEYKIKKAAETHTNETRQPIDSERYTAPLSFFYLPY